MDRDIYRELHHWKRDLRRKPLVLNGLRQVGKTYALKHFGKSAYQNTAYLNFEKDAKLRGYFEGTLDPAALVKILGIHTNVEIKPHATLLILDEIQECPKAINCLKYFCEEANDFHVIAAGSLLGVKTAKEKGFPVGKVNFLEMYPMTFFEFLTALGQEKIRTYLEEYSAFEPLPEPLHEKLIELLKQYFFVGGMPEVVVEYAREESTHAVREIQLELLEAYAKDFAKHAPPHEIMKISTLWDEVPRQLAKENKKFTYAEIAKHARGREYSEAFQWLSDAGLIHKSALVESPKFPLSHYSNPQSFKVYLADVGLLGAKSQLSPKVMIDGHHLFMEFKGALTENFVVQELIATQKRQPYYWTSQGTAEVDALIEEDHEIYPLEIKAGSSTKKKSLIVYKQKYHASKLLRASTMNLKHDGDVYNYPLYLVSRIDLLRHSL